MISSKGSRTRQLPVTAVPFLWQEDSRYEQKSDARAQLKFFEQLEQVEKQRKEEQEREILMKAAKVQEHKQKPNTPLPDS